MESDPLVAHVAPASPAYLAGIRDHDVLLKIDDLDITKWRTEPQLLRPRYWERPEGTTYRLTLKRGEREYQTTVVLKRILGPPAGDGSAASQSAAQPTEADRRFLAEVRAAAEKSDAHAQYDLGTIFHLGRLGVAKDEVEAVKWFRQAAEQNLPNAQNTLGSSYANGQGVTKDEFEAVKWYRKAADQNLAVAQFNLAGCYARGLGVAKDPVAAVKWYRQAAEQNFAEAQNNLAACYGNGQGVAKDEVEAVKWYRKAAEQGFPDAQNNLGVHYYKGQGAPQDYAEALKWIRQAAEQNYIEAQKNLAVFYFSGKAGTTNYVEAVKWFRKAAEQNSAEAQFGLGACYYGGQGVAKDYVQAYKWGLLALAQGLEPAREIVHQLETELTPKQILEGQKLARDFKPSLP
jgi:TPR repeat protein